MTRMFRRNVGGLDRAVRLFLGIILLPAGLFLLGGLQGNVIGIVVAVIGLIGLVSGAVGFCPMYQMCAVCCGKPKEAKPASPGKEQTDIH